MFKKTINEICPFSYEELIQDPNLLKTLKWSEFHDLMESSYNNNFNEDEMFEAEFEMLREFESTKSLVMSLMKETFTETGVTDLVGNFFKSNNIDLNSKNGERDRFTFLKLAKKNRSNFLKTGITVGQILSGDLTGLFIVFLKNMFMSDMDDRLDSIVG